MSERQTGATDEQVEAAAAEAWNETGATVPIDQMPRSNRFAINHRLDAKEWASRLVKPGQVITDAARVPTDDELAAMGNVASWTAHFAKDGTLGPELKRSAELVRAYLERQR